MGIPTRHVVVFLFYSLLRVLSHNDVMHKKRKRKKENENGRHDYIRDDTTLQLFSLTTSYLRSSEQSQQHTRWSTEALNTTNANPCQSKFVFETRRSIARSWRFQSPSADGDLRRTMALEENALDQKEVFGLVISACNPP